jgi:drug/metabolite transporter (DMT)-like permease
VLIGPETLLGLADQGLAFWGQLAIIGSTICYGLHTATTRLVRTVSSQELATATLALGAVIAVPAALTLSPDGLLQASLRSLVALLVLGTFQTALASLVLYGLLARAGASFTAMCNYLIPVFAVVLGALWLGEQVTPQIIAGSVLVLGGIAVSQQLYRRFLRY